MKLNRLGVLFKRGNGRFSRNYGRAIHRAKRVASGAGKVGDSAGVRQPYRLTQERGRPGRILDLRICPGGRDARAPRESG